MRSVWLRLAEAVAQHQPLPLRVGRFVHQCPTEEVISATLKASRLSRIGRLPSGSVLRPCGSVKVLKGEDNFGTQSFETGNLFFLDGRYIVIINHGQVTCWDFAEDRIVTRFYMNLNSGLDVVAVSDRDESVRLVFATRTRVHEEHL
jgi:hypothetical protein